MQKDIVGWPQYAITDDGRVFSKKRGKFLVPIKHSKGYLRVKLGGYDTRYIHRLVAEAYIPNPDNLPEVNHDDGDKEHNHYKNLYWATSSGNHKHAYKTGLKSATGIHNGRAKLTAEDVLEIRRQLSTGKTHQEIAIDFGISQPQISRIKTRASWKHI